MFLKRVKNFSKLLAVRLTLFFLILSIAGYAAVYFWLYFTIDRSLVNEEKAYLSRLALTLWARTQVAGPDNLIPELTDESYLLEGRPYFWGVLQGEDGYLYLNTPQFEWRLFLESSERREVDSYYYRLVSPQLPFSLLCTDIPINNERTLQVGISSEQRFTLIYQYRRHGIQAIASLLVISLIIGILMTLRALKPLTKLNQGITGVVTTGDLSKRLPATGSGDQLDELITHFNSMLSHVEELIERMRETLDTVAHDLRTPLTRLRMRAEAALISDSSLKEKSEVLSDTLEECDLLIKMVNTIMDITEAEKGLIKFQNEACDVVRLVKGVCEIYNFTAEERGILIKFEAPELLKTSVDPGRLRQVVGNLIDNSVKYTPHGGSVTVSLEENRGMLEITIDDDGVGIPESELPLIWDRLFRGERSRGSKGVGLGLSFVKAIVNAAGGTIVASNRREGGCRFKLTLPV